jgi:hypothetical protein
MYADVPGNVGIGTVNPATALHISRTVEPIIRLDNPDYRTWDIVSGGGGATQFNNKFFIYDRDAMAERLVIDDNGHVGIGTVSPEKYLHVDQPGPGGDGIVAIIGPGWNGGTSYNEGTQRLALLAWAGSGGLSLGQHMVGGYLIENEAQDLTFKSGYNGALGEKVRITRDGNVGVGTISPGAKLDVVSSTDYCVRSQASNTGDVENFGGYFTAAGRRGIGVYGHANYTGHDESGGSNYGGYFVAEGTESEYGMGGKPGTGIYAKGGRWAGDFDGPVRINGYASIMGNLTIFKRESATSVRTLIRLGEGLDYAEGFDVSDKKDIGAGSVLVIDADNPGELAISDEAYDSKVAGIVAGAKGNGSGVRLGADEFDFDVALAGRVYCNVDASEIGVEAGDLLTTSATPGYAMKATDYMRAQGAILGKAMEKLEKGKKAQILVLVTLQ